MDTQAMICKPHEKLKQETINEGREAFKNVLKGDYKDNPYSEGSTFYDWWEQGWAYELFESTQQ
jgi:hypothetical protein